MYAVYCRNKLLDDSKRRVVYTLRGLCGWYKGQCFVYRNIRSNMHAMCDRVNILNRYKCVDVSTVCDVRGRYVRIDCMYDHCQPGMYKLHSWNLLSDSKRNRMHTMPYDSFTNSRWHKFMYTRSRFGRGGSRRSYARRSYIVYVFTDRRTDEWMYRMDRCKHVCEEM